MKKIISFTFILVFVFCSIGCASIPPNMTVFGDQKPCHGSPFQYTLEAGAICTTSEDMMFHAMYMAANYDEGTVDKFMNEMYPDIFQVRYHTVVHVIQETSIGFVKVRAVDWDDKIFWTLKTFLTKGGW